MLSGSLAVMIAVNQLPMILGLEGIRGNFWQILFDYDWLCHCRLFYLQP